MLMITVERYGQSEHRKVEDGAHVRDLGASDDVYVLNGQTVPDGRNTELRDGDTVEVTRRVKAGGR